MRGKLGSDSETNQIQKIKNLKTIYSRSKKIESRLSLIIVSGRELTTSGQEKSKLHGPSDWNGPPKQTEADFTIRPAHPLNGATEISFNIAKYRETYSW